LRFGSRLFVPLGAFLDRNRWWRRDWRWLFQCYVDQAADRFARACKIDTKSPQQPNGEDDLDDGSGDDRIGTIAPRRD
jgi:hypothetical protein